MGFQVAFESESQQVENVPGGWSSNRKSATGQFGVYARNDEHRKSAELEVVHGSVPAR